MPGRPLCVLDMYQVRTMRQRLSCHMPKGGLREDLGMDLLLRLHRAKLHGIQRVLSQATS